MSKNNFPFHAEKIEFLKWQFEYVIDQIKVADNKINFLLAVYLALLSIVVTQIREIADIFIDAKYCLGQKILCGIFCSFFIICIAISFALVVKTVMPRTDPKKILGEEDYKSPIFWKDVADIGHESFKKIGLEERYSDLEKQVFITSSIAKVKFDSVMKAYILLGPTLIFFLILVILVKVIGG